jgi:hypothetical protein
VARRFPRWVGLAAFAAAVGACGNDAVGVDACQQIEEARCRAAAACPSNALQPPYYTAGTSVDACVRFYDVACLHGLAVPLPASSSVSACVAAIEDGGCAVVQAPQTDPSCAWLDPAATSSDEDAGVVSSSDAEASSSDAGASSVSDADTSE